MLAASAGDTAGSTTERFTSLVQPFLVAVIWHVFSAFPPDKLGDISRRYYGEEGSARKPLEVLGAERVSDRSTVFEAGSSLTCT
jgi:hypothetical protein